MIPRIQDISIWPPSNVIVAKAVPDPRSLGANSLRMMEVMEWYISAWPLPQRNAGITIKYGLSAVTSVYVSMPKIIETLKTIGVTHQSYGLLLKKPTQKIH